MAKATVARAAEPRNAFVYILQSATGLLKIGMSTDPESRLRALLTGHPFGLKIVYLLECNERLALPIEQCAHKLLEHNKVSGEWFSVSLDEAVWAIVNVLTIFEASIKAPPHEEWHWRCALDSRPTQSAPTKQDTVTDAPEPHNEREPFLGYIFLVTGVCMSILMTIAYFTGHEMTPPQVIENNVRYYGEWTRTWAYYSECGLYIVGPLGILTGLNFLRPDWRAKLRFWKR